MGCYSSVVWRRTQIRPMIPREITPKIDRSCTELVCGCTLATAITLVRVASWNVLSLLDPAELISELDAAGAAGDD